MKFLNLIEEITTEFITTCNKHEMDKMLGFLSNDIVLSSPLVLTMFPKEHETRLIGKEKVAMFWNTLNRNYLSAMRMRMLSKQNKQITCQFELGTHDLILDANFEMNEYGKFSKIEINSVHESADLLAS